jgi:hypothetical protein
MTDEVFDEENPNPSELSLNRTVRIIPGPTSTEKVFPESGVTNSNPSKVL